MAFNPYAATALSQTNKKGNKLDFGLNKPSPFDKSDDEVEEREDSDEREEPEERESSGEEE